MKIQEAENRRRYVVAGNSTVTLVSKTTGRSYTYRVSAPRDSGPDATVRFVGVLTGPDNETDYQYVGYMRRRPQDDVNGWVFLHGGRKARLPEDALSVMAFDWFWKHADSDQIEVLHSGRCGRCRRKLTVPESIETGLGPVCADR